MGAIQATRHQPPTRSGATSCGARPSPLMHEAARSTLHQRQGRTEHQTRHCEALGVPMHAETTRTRPSPWWLGSAAANTLAPVVSTTLAPVVNEEPPTCRIPSQVPGNGGPKGPVDPPGINGPLAAARDVNPCTLRARWPLSLPSGRQYGRSNP